MSYRPVTIQWIEANEASDAAGHVDVDDDENWIGVERFAEILTQGSREFFRGAQVQGEITHRLKLRTGPGDPLLSRLNTAMRVRIGNRNLNVTAAFDVNEDHEQIELHCKERP